MTLDMTKGRPTRLLLRFALPLMLSFMLQQLYTMCDSMIVGQLLGSEAFAAIGSSAYLNWFPLSMLIGLTQGFGVVLGQRFGAKDHEGFRRAFAMSTLLALAVSLLQTGVGVGLLYPFLHMLKTPTELMEHTAAYLRVLWLGLALSGFYNVLATALRALGDSRTPFVALVISTVVNIALDYLFLAAFHMGVEGAALATLLSQALATLLCLRGIRRVNDATPRKGEWRLHRATLRELLRLGLPPLLSFSVVSIGELVVQAAINLCGVVFVTGVTAARRYFSLLNIIGSALEGALATFVAQNTGARESQRILAGTRIAVLLGLGASVLTSVLVFVFAKPLILLFVPQGGAEIVRIGVEALRIETFFLWA
ncbi:MAG: MATE family efflux transporter, partial [Clostridia bacterium]